MTIPDDDRKRALEAYCDNYDVPMYHVLRVTITHESELSAFEIKELVRVEVWLRSWQLATEAALERAARECETLGWGNNKDVNPKAGTVCAEAIRSLKRDQPPSGKGEM